jgi:hypothetical protein
MVSTRTFLHDQKDRCRQSAAVSQCAAFSGSKKARIQWAQNDITFAIA